MADGDAPVDVIAVDCWLALAVDTTDAEVTAGAEVTMAADDVTG